MSNLLEAYEANKQSLEKAQTALTDAQAVYIEAENALEKHLEANLSNYILKDAKRVAPPKAVYALEKVKTVEAFETNGAFSRKRESNIYMKNAVSVYYNTNDDYTIIITVPEKNNDCARYYLNRLKTGRQLKSRTKRTRELLEPIEDGLLWMYTSYKVDEKYIAAQKRIKTDPVGLFKEFEK